MFILRQTSVKMAVLLHKQAKVPFILFIAVIGGTKSFTMFNFSGLCEISLGIKKNSDISRHFFSFTECRCLFQEAAGVFQRNRRNSKQEPISIGHRRANLY